MLWGGLLCVVTSLLFFVWGDGKDVFGCDFFVNLEGFEMQCLSVEKGWGREKADVVGAIRSAVKGAVPRGVRVKLDFVGGGVRFGGVREDVVVLSLLDVPEDFFLNVMLSLRDQRRHWEDSRGVGGWVWSGCIPVVSSVASQMYVRTYATGKWVKVLEGLLSALKVGGEDYGVGMQFGSGGAGVTVGGKDHLDVLEGAMLWGDGKWL